MVCSFCNQTIVINQAAAASVEVQAFKQRTLVELRQLLGASRKLDAIKLYRERFPEAGLKTAKEAIDALEMGQNLELPNPPTNRPPTYSVRLTDGAIVSGAGAARPRGRSGTACLLAVVGMAVALMTAGVVLIMALSSSGSSSFDDLFKNVPQISLRPAPLVFAPTAFLTTDEKAPDVVALLMHYDTDPTTYTLGRLSGATGKMVWETAPFAKGVTGLDELVTDSVRVYAVKEDQLTVYQAADGKELWHARLADKVACWAGGLACLRVQGEQVLVMSQDDTLQVYAAESGELLWQQQQAEYLYQNGVALVGDWVLTREPNQNAIHDLVFLDAANGQAVMRLVSKAVDRNSPVYVDSEAANLYTCYREWCEKWQLSGAGPQRVWQTQLTAFNFMDSRWLLGDKALYEFVEVDDQFRLQVVDLADGAEQLLTGYADYELTPLAVAKDRLLAVAKRTRGSERFELWALEPASGERVWQKNFDTEPLPEANGLVDADTSVWAWQLLSNQLFVIRFQADPHKLVIEKIALKTGQVSTTTTLDLPGVDGDFYSTPTEVGWRGSTLWFLISGKLYAADVEQGQFVLTP